MHSWYHRSRTDYISYDTLLDLTRSVHFPRLPPVKCVMACFFCARSSRMPFPITGQNYYSNLSCSSGFVLRTVKPVTDYEHKYIVVPLKHVFSVLDPGGIWKGDWLGWRTFPGWTLLRLCSLQNIWYCTQHSHCVQTHTRHRPCKGIQYILSLNFGQLSWNFLLGNIENRTSRSKGRVGQLVKQQPTIHVIFTLFRFRQQCRRDGYSIGLGFQCQKPTKLSLAGESKSCCCHLSQSLVDVLVSYSNLVENVHVERM